ncbi:sporulation protein YtxC [Gracilibacillus sp. S3-1-1]|uniref:Sporulation protein YtxC n=1 Tax=Gracilibacillus pellucidus TaxID=3095368 RepID=A0ACC6M7D6_9BACI|nr:sporulation protein YtxC [Gracilibacillus sp. S3-1-1]MDX8046677.1 sporulation protein YtxC [Gracilibacillus sp. S3-1-1]
MIEVFFEEVNEAEVFYYLAKQDNDWNVIRKRITKNLVQLEPNIDMTWDEVKECVAPLLSRLFIQCREPLMIQQILKKKYHFSNKEEIERITSIAKSLLEKDESIYEDRIHQHELRDTLTMIFSLQIDTAYIQFDSIVHFRIHHYMDQLTEMVGLAIDEFKREEEYQDFIHSIREFIKRKNPVVDELHVIQGETFQIYRENGELYTIDDLRKVKERFPLFIFGLEQEEWDISPLIMLAPNHIFMYGEDQTESRTHTILTIFQERCSFYPMDYFPFCSVDEKES